MNGNEFCLEICSKKVENKGNRKVIKKFCRSRNQVLTLDKNGECIYLGVVIDET